jgi:hypothetical protein
MNIKGLNRTAKRIAKAAKKADANPNELRKMQRLAKVERREYNAEMEGVRS